jgi:hypothetical protein
VTRTAAQARQAFARLPQNLVVMTDPYPFYQRELERRFGPAWLLRCSYNFIRPHARLRLGKLLRSSFGPPRC